MTADPVELIGLLATEMRPLVQEHYPGMPTCVLSTRIAYDVCRYYGVACEPLSVVLIAGNERWVEWMVSLDWKPTAETPLPEGAWSVGVDPNRPAARNRWNGHLVLSVAGGILDCDLGYWARPGQGIHLPGGAFFVNGPDAYTAPEGGLVLYRERVLDDRIWARSRDWNGRGRRKRIVGSLIRQAKGLYV